MLRQLLGSVGVGNSSVVRTAAMESLENRQLLSAAPAATTITLTPTSANALTAPLKVSVLSGLGNSPLANAFAKNKKTISQLLPFKIPANQKIVRLTLGLTKSNQLKIVSVVYGGSLSSFKAGLPFGKIPIVH